MFEMQVNCNLDSILGIIDDTIQSFLDEARVTILNYYEANREFYETVTLLDDSGERASKRIPTVITVDYEKGNLAQGIIAYGVIVEGKRVAAAMNIQILTPSKLESMILRAQHIGTGLNINKEITDYFGVETDTGNKLRMSKKYFNPNGAHIRLRNDINTLLGGKSRIA